MRMEIFSNQTRAKSLVLGLGLSALLGVNQVNAVEWMSVYNSPRGNMLGNAMTAQADDYSALFYNPAGLSDVKNWNVQLPSIQASGSSAIMDFINNDLKTIVDNASGAADAFSGKTVTGDPIGKLTAAIQGLSGKKYHGDVDMIPLAVTVNGFSLALLASEYLTLSAGAQSPLPALTLFSRTQAGMAAGFSMKFLEDQLRVGIAAKVLARYGLDKTIDIGNSLTSGSTTEISELTDVSKIMKKSQAGVGYDVDLGVQYFVPIPQYSILENSRLKFGAVIQNILNMDFVKLSNDIGTLKKDSVFALDRTLNLGTSFDTGELWGFWRNEFSLDFRNLLRSGYSKSWGTYLAMGLESRVQMSRWLQAGLRLGLNDGYHLSYGGMVRLGIFTFEGGVYGVEMGGYPGQRPDKRVIVRFALEI